MTVKKATHKKVTKTTPDEITNGADEPVVTETVAGEPIRIDDEHAVVKDNGGQVVRVVDVPAHEVEIPLGFSSIEGLALAAAKAWDTVKADDDAPFAAANPDFRREMINVAEEIYNSGQTVTHAGTTRRLFEEEILKFRTAQAEKPKAA